MKKTLHYFGGFVGLICAVLLVVLLIAGAMGLSFAAAYIIAQAVIR